MKGVFSNSNISFEINESIKSGKLSSFEEFALENNIDEVFYTLPLTNTNEIKELIDFLQKFCDCFEGDKLDNLTSFFNDQYR